MPRDKGKEVRNGSKKEINMNRKMKLASTAMEAVNKLFKAIFGRDADSSSLESGWYEYHPGTELTVRLNGNNVLIIDLESKEISFFSKSTDGWRDIPAKGQWTRVKALLDIFENGEQDARKSEVFRIADSLIRWKTEEVKIEVWSYSVREDVPYFLKETEDPEVAGVEITYVRNESGVRRSMPLNLLGDQYVIAKLVMGDKDEVIMDDDSLIEDGEVPDNGDFNGRLAGATITDDPVLKEEIRRKVIAHYKKFGYDFIGGNTKSGLMVFVKNAPETLGELFPVDADASQKLAKLLLRGGMRLELGESFTAELKRFPKNGNDARDGLFMIVRRGIQRSLAKANGLPKGIVWQSTFVNNESAMKGTIMGATIDNPSTLKLLGGAEAVIDLEEYNKITGANRKEGDLIVVNPGDIWVMRTSGERGKKSVHISAQVVRRAPGEIAAALHRMNLAMLRGFIKASTSDDKRALYNYIPSFGMWKKIKQAGLRPMLRYEYDEKKRSYNKDKTSIPPALAKSLEDWVLRSSRKGWTLPGWSEYIIHDGSLSIDTGDQVPGISVPKSWGKNAGDTLVMLAYPILPALDEKGRSTGAFTCRIERLNDADFVGIHPQVAKYALRDEDGDQPIFIELNHKPIGLAHLSLTTKIGGKLENQPLVGDGSFADSMAVLDVFMRQGADVGRIDNMATSIMLYTGGQVENTPTGEPLGIYLSKCIQSTIESMKHVVDAAYGSAEVNSWIKGMLPEALDPEKDSFMKHPELDAQKVRGADGTFKNVTLADLAKAVAEVDQAGFPTSLWMELMRESTKWQLTKEGFVAPSYYVKVGVQMYKALKELADPDRVIEIARMVEKIRKEAILTGNKKGWKAAKMYLKRVSCQLREELPAAEFFIAQAAAMFVSQTSSFVWTEFCTIEFLKAIAQLAEEPDFDPWKALGLTRRNRTTVKSRETKVDLSSGYVTTRLWVSGRELGENEIAVGDLVAGMGTTAVVNNTIYNVKGTLIGAFTVVSVDRRTAKGANVTVEAAKEVK